MTGQLGSTPPPEWPFTGALSAREMRGVFDETSHLTVGIEEELTLADPATLEQTPAVELILERAGGDSRFARELKDTQIEIVTPVAGNALGAALHLAQARLDLAALAGRDALLVASGAFPGPGHAGEVVEGERYEQIADHYPTATAGNLPSGQHVHVAVQKADRALAVYNAARSYLPDLCALAANSPFLDGRDVGLASARRTLNDAFQRTGVPPAFPTWEALADFVAWGRRGGLFPDWSYFWWELRPHLRYGTLELRATDTQTRLEDALAVAAVWQALVAWLADLHDAGELPPVHPTVRIEENAWRAIRYGIRGWMVDLDTGEPVRTRDRIGSLLEQIEPHAKRIGGAAGLHTARALLVDNGADRQRSVEEAKGMEGLVRWLADETIGSAEDMLMQRA